MRKRLLPFVLILLIGVPAGVFLLRKRDKITYSYRSQAITAVPDDAVWIIETRSVPGLLKSLIHSEPLFQSLQQMLNLKPYLLALKKIDSLITFNPRYKQLFAHKPAVFSLHQTGKNQYQFLMTMENAGPDSESGVGELFGEWCGQPGSRSQRRYNGQQINRINFSDTALVQGISTAVNKNFLMLCPSPVLLENAVRQMNQETGFPKNTAFARLSQAGGKSALATLYINLRVFPAWMSGWMNPEVKRKLETFTKYGDWASLGLTIRNDAILFNGFALEGDTLNSYLNLFKNQSPQKLLASQYLPCETAACFSLGVENPARYLKDLSDYLGGGESGRKRQRIIDKAFAVVREDVVKVWADQGFRELAIGYLCSVADDSVRPVALIEVRSGNQLADKLVAASHGAGSKVFRADSEHEFTLNPMPYAGLPEILGGSFFSSVSGNFFTVIGNVLILADDLQTLEEVLHKYSLNKTLANDAVYLSMAGMFSARSNVTFFANPYKASPLLEEILNPKSGAAFFTNGRFLLKTGAIGLQFHSVNGMSLHTVFASFAEIDYSKPQILWESRLDAKALTRPAVVKNPVTLENEIMVQDESSNLYLVNSSGRILWKKNIGEGINSDIFQVDVMKNGRLQYLFSTGHAIHLLDRNGEYLPKYPLQLKLPATNGMALMDFEGNLDYRMVIACSDNKIHVFDKGGTALKGWNFGPDSGAITRPVEYFKILDKDYLVFSDPAQVYVLGRKGSVKGKGAFNEFGFIDRNDLDIYKQAGVMLASRKPEAGVSNRPGFYKGFPLPGQTPFTIGKLEKSTAYQNLLVGGEDGYLYNYAIK